MGLLSYLQWTKKTDISILSLYFNYAIVYTSSPLFLAREGIWELLARESDGRAVLERARDAAFATVSAVCSVSGVFVHPLFSKLDFLSPKGAEHVADIQPEIGRTLVYSFSLFRPILAASLILLINLTSLSTISPPLISTTHVNDVLRSTSELISSVRPLDWDAGGGMLSEIVERGDGRISGEAGGDLWKGFIG